MEQEVILCDEVETVSEFTYLGDRVSAGGGCEAAATARKDKKIHGESNVWSAAQRQKNIYGFDVHAGFEGVY